MSGRPEGVRSTTPFRDAAQHHRSPPPCGPGLPLRTLLHRRLTWGLAVTRVRGSRPAR
ncbi:hypothetical protein [Streptomyces sp. NPDC089799]|uniref:hypothetical protein n=1 Tax=Streptomyces sp. NPDC089799 TaxID=3155066 RepID=UPI0034160CCF